MCQETIVAESRVVALEPHGNKGKPVTGLHRLEVATIGHTIGGQSGTVWISNADTPSIIDLMS